MRVFGYLYFPNTYGTSAHKLAPRSTRCVFLRYALEHKGYRCLDLQTRRVLISPHVTFDEPSSPTFPGYTTSPARNLLATENPALPPRHHTSGLQIHCSTASTLFAYSDANWAGCPDTRAQVHIRVLCLPRQGNLQLNSAIQSL